VPRDYSAKSPAAYQRLPDYKRDDEAWIRDLLCRAETGILATRWEDQPFATPTSFWFDEENRRITFHSNIAGRLRANLERHPQAGFVVYEQGRYLPSNVALEFGVQYRSVMVFGPVEVVADPAESRRLLYGLLKKYFPKMEAGREYRPITDKELARTTVYLMKIESWSGKENWHARADQSDGWPVLDAKWFE
jgi:nitroimidazol reductase NimA-like FMN-containing flavoprotein (pyridoxamine 5'-phosphate oxidase superfamily)